MKTLSIASLSVVLGLGLILPPCASGADPDKKVSDGERIYRNNCSMCHFPDKAEKKMGPGLKDLFKNKELPQSHRPVADTVVREQIEKGSKAMPAFAKKLPSAEIDSLMEYLKTL